MSLSTDVRAAHPHHRHGWWWKTLLVGFLLWVVTIVVTITTLNTNLVPTIILLGSFLVPFTVVLFVIERVTGTVSTMQLIVAFFVGGILGVLGASLLEANLQQDALVYIVVGFVEEFVKGVLLLFVGWRVRPKTARQGALLGATVGAGFAAFESAGYALQTMLANIHGHTVINILETQAFRGVLAPFGHITWTALIGGALFASTRSGRFVFSPRLGWTLVGVAALHAIWDQSYGWAIMFTRGILEGSWHIVWPNAQTWYGPPTSEAMIWFNVSYDTLLVLNALVGTAWIIYEWRVYGRWRADAAAGASAGTDVASAA
jgi:RsiW-degrading membrane proteinase PrsW (M82 family)